MNRLTAVIATALLVGPAEADAPRILTDIAPIGGFNRTSQHSILGGVDDNRQPKIRTIDAG